MDLLFEDSGYFDLTTFGLGIGDALGSMSFASREEIILSGCDEVEAILKKCGLKYKFFKESLQKATVYQLSSPLLYQLV
jgi:molybdenum transport protein